jgi:basic amino acid/polyamine antiporter, APA family
MAIPARLELNSMALITAAQNEEEPTLTRDLGLRDASAIVVGTIIGSGIFLVPSSIAGELHSLLAVLLAWLVGGLLTLSGALALGELGAAFPGTGGLYVYLRCAYGSTTSFLYGWGLLTLIQSGTIATLAVGFRIYLAQIVPLTIVSQKLAGVLCVLLLTAVNCFGLRAGKTVQNLFTGVKLSGLTVMVALLLLWGHAHPFGKNFWPQAPVRLHAMHFATALIGVLWAYEGWHVVSFTAGEFRNVRRDLPLGLLYGTLLVVAIYLIANVAYYTTLKPEQIQQTDRVAASAIGSLFGSIAAIFISALILLSIIGAMNGMILTGPRVYYAMAKEGLFFRAFANLNRFRSPFIVLLVQGFWAASLTLLGTFQELFTYVVFTGWIFYGLAVSAVIVLRIRHPEIERPFRVPAYPWLPGFFTLAAIGVTVGAVVAAPFHAVYGIALILTGLPVYAVLIRASKSNGLSKL